MFKKQLNLQMINLTSLFNVYFISFKNIECFINFVHFMNQPHILFLGSVGK